MSTPRSRRRGGKRLHGVDRNDTSSSFDAVYDLVRRIPHGRVATYGQISNLLGNLLSPLAVGWALHSCPEGVPWQRVVNAAGSCSTDRLPDIPPGLQRAMLESEGVVFGEDGTIDLERFRWEP
jgi:methylated-DNA-protein-cysteine methyltransferase-like protein